MSQGEEDEWLIYKFTLKSGISSSTSSPAQSDDVRHANAHVSTPVKPLVVQVYSQRQTPDDTCPAPPHQSS